jgi:hypothetical protein
MLPFVFLISSVLTSANIDVYEDYKHSELRFASGRCMELDVYAPQLSLAIEYQGEQHYKNIYPFMEQKQHAERDKEKRDACNQVFNSAIFHIVLILCDGTKV